MMVVTLDSAGEGKGQQQVEESENCVFDRSALLRGLMLNAKAAAKLDEDEHDREHKQGADRIEDHDGGITITNSGGEVDLETKKDGSADRLDQRCRLSVW